MKRTCTFIFLAGLGAAAAACGGVTNSNVTTNAANMRGTNTNTGYLTNANTSVPPPMPANVTNISPPNMNTGRLNPTRSSPTPARMPPK